MTSKPLNFGDVEALRNHMLLTTAQMAKYLDVSRITYSGWAKGTSKIRKGNEVKVRKLLRRMMDVMTEQKWPKPEIEAMTSKQRFETLVALMGKPE